MLEHIQLTLLNLFVIANVRSRHWVRIHTLRRHPTTERIEEAILCRHRLRYLMEEFLDSEEPHLQNIAANTLWPMLEDLDELIPEAERRLEG